MQDLVKGEYRQHGEEKVKVTDGTSCGIEMPTKEYELD
jgi:formamidase